MQAGCLLLGIPIALFISSKDYRAVPYSVWLTIPVLVLMLLTFTPLGYEVPGTDDRNWLLIPLFGKQFLIQPSELLKITVILTLSHHIETVGERIKEPLSLLGLLIHAAIPVLLIFLQGDDGNAVVCLIIVAALLFIGGIPLSYALGGIVLSLAAIPLLWQRMSVDKKSRFLCLFQVENYRQTTGWQQDLSVTAIGSGRWCGVGYLQGGNDHLYARQNDFIFTVSGEEFGFVGAILLIGLLTMILLLLYRTALRASTRRGFLICGGLMVLIATQAVINIGMALRLMPVLGITLPFFSAGGSSLLTLFLGIGIAMSVYRYRH